MIYLDNSSTTHKKPFRVILNSMKGLLNLSINPSRASYKQGIIVQEKIYKCREKMAEMINTDANKIIFTSGCTMAINLGLKGTAKKNGHIITTVFEHNSVLRVLENLKCTHNISYTLLTPNKNGQITTSDIIKNIKPETYMVVINHTSNVTGTTQNIDAIGKICKRYNLLFFVDGAQSVGHEEIDMKKSNINMLSIAGHKGLYAPFGIGVLAINNCKISPLIHGGTGTQSNKLTQPNDYPDGFESGTQNIIGILGLSAGIDFVNSHKKRINKKIHNLTRILLTELNTIKNVNLYSSNPYSGVVSFTINNKDSVEISNALSEEFNICTRSGLHCAGQVHKYYNTLKSGMTRISISYFNRKSEIKKVIKAIQKIALS